MVYEISTHNLKQAHILHASSGSGPFSRHSKRTAPDRRTRFLVCISHHCDLDAQGTSASANNALRALCERVRQCTEAGVLDDAMRLAESVILTVFQVLGPLILLAYACQHGIVYALVSLFWMHSHCMDSKGNTTCFACARIRGCSSDY